MLQGVTVGDKGLEKTTRDYKSLQGGRRGSRRLQEITRGYRGVTRGYKKITRGYRGLQGVTGG